MKKIHAHEILRMMEGNYYTEETLKGAILQQFGTEARFFTCSIENLNADEIIAFLKHKGKFKPSDNGFTMDIDKVCDTY